MFGWVIGDVDAGPAGDVGAEEAPTEGGRDAAAAPDCHADAVGGAGEAFDLERSSRDSPGWSDALSQHFSEQARRVMVLAEEDARALEQSHVGSEHILLGLLRETDSLAARVLASLDITGERVRAEILRTVPAGRASAERIPLTGRAQNVLEFAVAEAQRLGDDRVAPAHLLLGVVRAKNGVGARILLELTGTDVIHDRVIRMLAEDVPAEERIVDQPTPPGEPPRGSPPGVARPAEADED